MSEMAIFRQPNDVFAKKARIQDIKAYRAQVAKLSRMCDFIGWDVQGFPKRHSHTRERL